MPTTYKYDGFGHQIERNHPDAGTTKWQYDNAGNLIATQTQRQINDNTQTRYVYDYNRLIRTEYPQHPQLDVHYRYDSVGRLAERTDLTGSITYQYDELGNIIQENRHIILPNESKSYTFETRYNYDLLGRMRQIIYPDSEKVNYHYQLGQLTAIKADKQTLAQGLQYDEYDHLKQMTFGNGYTQTNSYDANRLWLTKVYTYNIFTSIGRRLILQNVDYGYDGVGNVVSKSEEVQVYPFASLKEHHASTSGRYEYDAANRLVFSTGSRTTDWGAANMNIPNYAYAISYSPSGMITSKTTTLDGTKTALRYGYEVPPFKGDKGGFKNNHQIQTITSGNDTTKLTWDVDGQLSTMQRENQEGEPRNTRRHVWNENGQLAMFISDEGAGYYGYDGNGERVYKLTGYVHRDGYNAGEETTQVMLNDVVLYANPYFIVTPKGYTKHYYNGSQRLAAVVGDIASLPKEIVKDGDNTKAVEYTNTFANSDTLVNIQVDWEKDMLLPILSKMATSQPASIYYYHGDHLGSASWITDGKGDVIEHRRYLPYGEEWYHKRFNESYTERFTFTGKERDAESGYDYFGARFYDSRLLTGWLSVDPLAGKYPYMNPYAYCENNPLKNIDPDGKRIVIGSFWGRVAAKFGANNFEKKTQNYLNSLKKNNSELRQAIEGMEKNQNLDVKIKPYTEQKNGKNGATKRDYPNPEVEQGSTIYYDPDNSRKVEGVDVSPEGILSHELGHADDYMNGDGYKYKYDKNKAKQGLHQQETERQKGNQAEEKAIRFENYVRKKEGKPQRSYEYYKKNEE